MKSAFENTDSLLRGGRAQRVGLCEFLWSDTLAAWVRQGYPTRTERREAGENRWNPMDGTWEKIEKAGEYTIPVPPEEHFGFDIFITGGIELMPLRGVSEVVEETAEWVVRCNGAGASLKWWKHKSGTPEHIVFRMTSREVWERDYRPHLLAAAPAGYREELAITLNPAHSPARPKGFRSRWWTAPTYAGGRLFCRRDDGLLLCLRAPVLTER
jgi:hypothetical protein